MKQQKLGEKGHLRATECHISLVNGVLQIPGEFKGLSLNSAKRNLG